MSWSGGVFTRIMNWVNDKNAAIPITASRMDTDSNDFASGINSCLNKDASNSPTSALNMGALRVTNIANGTALTDAASLSQVQAGLTNWGVAGGTADALTLTLSPSQTTIADGTLVYVRSASANATTTPTFALNAQTARTITRRGGGALLVGDIPGALAENILRYNLANTRWELLNPAGIKQPTRQVFLTGTAATYTTPTGATRINVRAVGGGGGGGGTGAGGGAGSGGTATTFSTLTASGGAGSGAAGSAAINAGGAAAGGDVNLSGGSGQGGNNTNNASTGGQGGASAFGGTGAGGGPGTAGASAPANTGGGGGGGGGPAAAVSAGGGGAGGYAEKLILTPAATYTYTIGAAGAGGSAGGGGTLGGAGGTGIIIVDEYYN